MELKPHPATFSKNVLETAADIINTDISLAIFPYAKYKILDPMAGIGGIHKLTKLCYPHHVLTYGIELEKEWAEQHSGTAQGNLFDLLKKPQYRNFDCIFTSPTYGNRMADHHEAKDGSHRRTYKHYLGRDLSENNSGQMQWGREYQMFHHEAWNVCYDTLKPGGLMLLNISDHIRKGEVVPVTAFHIFALQKAGFHLVRPHKVITQRYRFGANAEARVPNEYIIEARKD